MKFIEILYWLLIALCPIIVTSIISFFVWKLSESLLSCVITEGCGILAGIYLAEYIRKKYGCSNFYSKLMNTSDLDENP